MSTFEQRRAHRAQLGRNGEKEYIGPGPVHRYGGTYGYAPPPAAYDEAPAIAYDPARDPTPLHPLERYGFTMAEIGSMSADEYRGWITLAST